MTLTTHHLEFLAEARTMLALRGQAGSAIRGALVGALWERGCTNQSAPSCAECPLFSCCAVSALVAPLRAEGETGGEQRPRPYVIQPPPAQTYAPGEQFAFRVRLFGRAAPLFPYVVMAARQMEERGLGRRDDPNDSRRGQVRIVQIDAVNPLSGARQRLYTHGSVQVHSPGLPVTAATVEQYAAQLPSDRLRLVFQTPLRLIDKGQLVRTFAVRPLVQRLKERLDELAPAYGDGALSWGEIDLVAAAAAVRVVADDTHWVDVSGYSSRQQRRLPLGGLVGGITLTGDLAPLRTLLVWGSLVHAGKNAVKGDGWYRLSAD